MAGPAVTGEQAAGQAPASDAAEPRLAGSEAVQPRVAGGGEADPPTPVLAPPYLTVLKPYGRALVELARGRPEIVCLSGDLTRQCEVDLFQAELGDRFIQAGMAEANMIGVAGALARSGLIPFVHSFGVFTTRRPYDQIVNAIVYPGLPVRLVGFMPGISSPGGPSHQAIEDISLMRALPGMTVIDVADATQTAQAVAAIADLPGPVYLRLKRGEIPVIFPGSHRFELDRAQVLADGPGGPAAGGDAADEPATGASGTATGASAAASGTAAGASAAASGAGVAAEVALLACGMMVAPALAAAAALRAAGVGAVVVNVPVIKPLDTRTVLSVAAAARVVITAENHSIIGGLGSAVAEALAEAGLGRALRRVGLADTFAEGALGAPYLFTKYGLTTQHLIDAAWSALARPDPAPRAQPTPAQEGEYAPV